MPYSDTSVITAAACAISPVLHAKTQIPQVLGACAISLLGYVALGLGEHVFWVLALGLVLVWWISRLA